MKVIPIELQKFALAINEDSGRNTLAEMLVTNRKAEKCPKSKGGSNTQKGEG